MDNKNLDFLQKYKMFAFVAFFFVTVIYIILTATSVIENTGTGQIINSNLGTVGDYFGGLLNPIFALLALFALLATIKIQSEELKLTREEMKKSNDVLDKQSKSIKKQNFEDSFFNLLKKFNFKVDNDFDFKSDSEDNLNRFTRFEKIRYKLYEYHEYYEKEGDKVTSEHTYDCLFEFEIKTKRLDEYFRYLFFIIDFVEDSFLSNNEKEFYLRILFRDLTYNEEFLLFYHCLTFEVYNKYKKMIEHYSLFERVSHKSLIYPRIDLIKYNISAFKNNKAVVMQYKHYEKELRNN